MRSMVFDMETGDPDDFLTLCLLATHPGVALRAVTVNPGSHEQVGLVRWVLRKLEKSLPVGSRVPDRLEGHVSTWHHKFVGTWDKEAPTAPGHEVLAEVLAMHPDTTILTGGPLQNLRFLLTHHPTVVLPRWVGQGGFAGDSVVPEEYRLPKFMGKETCETYNFGGDPKGARLLLEDSRVLRRELVAKNVCHGVVYDAAMHKEWSSLREEHPGFALFCAAMEHYLSDHPGGKALHDPLAASVAIDPEVCEFRSVEVYSETGRWGSRLKEGTQTFIAIRADVDRMKQVLSGKTEALQRSRVGKSTRQ